MRARAVAAAALLATGALTLSACSHGDHGGASDVPAQPAPVAFHATVPAHLTIGVIVSLTSPPGQGSQWSSAAEGAEVAAYRFGLGNRRVTVRAADDKGTVRGARAAARTLIEGGASGLVVATSGSHLQGALDEAAQAGVPVLLPYDDGAATGLRDIAWTTGPDRAETSTALQHALSAAHLKAPLLVDAGGIAPSGVTPADTVRLTAGGDAQRVARIAAQRARSGAVDSVLVAGPADAQAAVVAALQGSRSALPVLLTPDALSPAFATALGKDGGSLSGDLRTVGADAGEPAAMRPGAEGAALSAYFAAVRTTAGDDRVHDFFDGRSFATVADDADVRSHDAVVALVVAASRAGSTDPHAVARALGTLHLGHADGLAGPPLDFGSRAALQPDAMVTLQATAQDLGLRPPGTAPTLSWFAAPASSQ